MRAWLFDANRHHCSLALTLLDHAEGAVGFQDHRLNIGESRQARGAHRRFNFIDRDPGATQGIGQQFAPEYSIRGSPVTNWRTQRTRTLVQRDNKLQPDQQRKG